jgi:hypothetical protein
MAIFRWPMQLNPLFRGAVPAATSVRNREPSVQMVGQLRDSWDHAKPGFSRFQAQAGDCPVPRPGEVATDTQAFQQILVRLRDDVGTLIALTESAKQVGTIGSGAPFWALVRMMMPIAESIGDLVYRKTPSANLICVLENEFEAVHPGYRGKAALIAVLYRHGLMHHDELRCLQTAGRELFWSLSFGIPKEHLRVSSDGAGHWGLHFDLHAFYGDLVAVGEACVARAWGGAVKDRYNSWLDHNLDTENGSAAKQARQEMAKL